MNQKLSQSTKEVQLIARARQVLPAGHYGNMDIGHVISRGKGSRVWDESGNEYIDYLIGSGPMLVGHAHPEVTQVVAEQIENGTTFFAINAHGIALAEEIVAAMACAEKIRFVSSGSEATLYAMRVARAYRGRDKILKFEGGYHGMSDYALMSLAPKREQAYPKPIPDSAGIPARMTDEVLVAPFNDLDTVEQLLTAHADDLAAVIVEPFQRLIPPRAGFLEGLRRLTEQHGILLIFDEIVTGFRLAYGGAQAYYGVTPDLCTLGKVIGGGFPLAAVAGREDIMNHFDKSIVGASGFTFQVGTLSGNPVAAAAGLKTLEILKRPGAYETLFEHGKRIMNALDSAFSNAGISIQIVGEPPLFDAVFTDKPVTNYRDILHANADMLHQFNSGLFAQGVLKGDSKFYISLSLTDDDIKDTVNAIQVTATAMAN